MWPMRVLISLQSPLSPAENRSAKRDAKHATSPVALKSVRRRLSFSAMSSGNSSIRLHSASQAARECRVRTSDSRSASPGFVGGCPITYRTSFRKFSGFFR